MNDLHGALLSFAEPPLRNPQPLADLERRIARRRRRRRGTRAALVGLGVAVVAGTLAIVLPQDQRTVGVTAGPPTSLAAPTTGSASGPCRNSTNPACGAFRWEPEPAAQPVTVRVTADPASPKVGAQVVFIVEVSSPAGMLVPAAVESGDGGRPQSFGGQQSCTDPQLGERYGAWDLPAPKPFTITQRYVWTYKSAGTFTARFVFRGSACNPQHTPVYPSSGEGTVTVTVQPFAPLVVPQGWAACTADSGAFAVAYPASWEQGQCGAFDPDLPRHSEAAVLNVVAVRGTLADAEAALQNPTWQPVTSRTETSVNGRRAVRIEQECVPACGVAERETTWLLDGGTSVVELTMRWDPSLGDSVYNDRQRILEQAMRSVRM